MIEIGEHLLYAIMTVAVCGLLAFLAWTTRGDGE